jgi:hypothetical protein
VSFLPFLVTREVLAVDGGGGAAIFNSYVAIKLHSSNSSIDIKLSECLDIVYLQRSAQPWFPRNS